MNEREKFKEFLDERPEDFLDKPGITYVASREIYTGNAASNASIPHRCDQNKNLVILCIVLFQSCLRHFRSKMRWTSIRFQNTNTVYSLYVNLVLLFREYLGVESILPLIRLVFWPIIWSSLDSFCPLLAILIYSFFFNKLFFVLILSHGYFLRSPRWRAKVKLEIFRIF